MDVQDCLKLLTAMHAEYYGATYNVLNNRVFEYTYPECKYFALIIYEFPISTSFRIYFNDGSSFYAKDKCTFVMRNTLETGFCVQVGYTLIDESNNKSYYINNRNDEYEFKII